MTKVIKKTLKTTTHFCGNVFQTLLFCIKVLIRTDLKNHIPQIENAGPLTILANGPSLKDDIEKIDFEVGDFSVLNDFYKSPYFDRVKPKFYVLADPLYFTKDSETELTLRSITSDIKLFVPFGWWKNASVLDRINNPHIQFVPYHTLTYNGFESVRYWFYRHGLSMPRPQNVLVPSIFNAINMGYKEIRIYGADHSWTESIRVDEQNRVCLTDSHFYDTEKVNMNPWHKCTGEQYLMHEILRDLASMFDSYHFLKRYADARGCRIINCTKNSYIDAFERS